MKQQRIITHARSKKKFAFTKSHEVSAPREYRERERERETKFQIPILCVCVFERYIERERLKIIETSVYLSICCIYEVQSETSSTLTSTHIIAKLIYV